MHLLKELLPAAMSCARTTELAANDMVRTSAVRIIFFMACALHTFGERRRGCGRLLHEPLAMNKRKRLGSSYVAYRFGIADILRRRATQNRSDVLDSS